MAGVLRTLALVASAYVLCPVLILVTRENLYCGVGAITGLLSVAGAHLYGNRQRDVLRWHRLTNGLCVTCGYDLRETPFRCPECGSSRFQPAHRA